VAWFDVESWDATDYRRARVASTDITAVRERLDQQAAALRATGAVIEVVVLDCSYARPEASTTS
jgi:hypothetical protein